VGKYATVGEAYGIRVVGARAYLADGDLRVFDISNPAHPVHLGLYVTPSFAYRVEVVGKFALVADAGAGLHVIDVSDPGQMVRVDGYDTVGTAQGVCIVGLDAFVADGPWGLTVVEVPVLRQIATPHLAEAQIVQLQGQPHVSLSLVGAPGFFYSILAADGLEPGRQWLNVATIEMGQAASTYIDPQPVSAGRRFYRAALRP
jgi:hypothetical protein